MSRAFTRASGCRATAGSSSVAELAWPRELIVRGTPVQMLVGGAGPEVLFLHGAGGAGRWLESQSRLAEQFTVRFPSHPGHGGSPAAEWIQHISDLAFH